VKNYLLLLGMIIIVLGVTVGAIQLSVSYNEYQSRIQAVGAPAGSPQTLYDVVKWQFARLVGGALLFGALIFGSVLMGLGWIGKTLEEIRDSLSDDAERSPESLAHAQASRD
jgi:hypothetical protein